MSIDRLRPSETVRASLSNDGLVLLDIDGGIVLAANAVGAEIWRLMDAGCADEDIARRLAEQFDVPLARAAADVAAFVASLASRGLIVRNGR